nr:putative reverse transcriptase domain-containing protein [Tanacetum cinerariifolium]
MVSGGKVSENRCEYLLQNWSSRSQDRHLPLVEFSYNNDYHTSIKAAHSSHFTVISVDHLSTGLRLEIVNSLAPRIIHETTEKIIQIKNRIQAAHDRQKSYADRHLSATIDDPRPAAGSFSMADVRRLSTHVIKLRDMPKGVLVLSGLSHVCKSCICDLKQNASTSGATSSYVAKRTRDVSREAIHVDFFPFSAGPYYATYPEGGVAGNYKFTHEEPVLRSRRSPILMLGRLFRGFPFTSTPFATTDIVIPDPTLSDLFVGTPNAKILAKAKSSQKQNASTSSATSSYVAKRTRSALAQSSSSTTCLSLFVGNSDDGSDTDDACIEPMVTLFRVFQMLCKQGDWFSFAKRRAPSPVCIDDNRSCMKPAAGSFSMADVRRLSTHVIKLRDMPKGVLVLSGLSHVCKSCIYDLVLQGVDENSMGASFDYVLLHLYLLLLAFIVVFLFYNYGIMSYSRWDGMRFTISPLALDKEQHLTLSRFEIQLIGLVEVVESLRERLPENHTRSIHPQVAFPLTFSSSFFSDLRQKDMESFLYILLILVSNAFGKISIKELNVVVEVYLRGILGLGKSDLNGDEY